VRAVRKCVLGVCVCVCWWGGGEGECIEREELLVCVCVCVCVCAYFLKGEVCVVATPLLGVVRGAVFSKIFCCPKQRDHALPARHQHQGEQVAIAKRALTLNGPRKVERVSN